MREVDHGRDLSVVNASLVQFGVDVLGNPVGRPTHPRSSQMMRAIPMMEASWPSGSVKPIALS